MSAQKRLETAAPKLLITLKTIIAADREPDALKRQLMMALAVRLAAVVVAEVSGEGLPVAGEGA